MRNDLNNPADRDELLLIDYLLGRADGEPSREVESRLQSDAAFRRRSEALANTFAALRLLPQAEPPDGLVGHTVARVALARKTDEYVARQETARPWALSTFTLREALAVAASIILLISVFVPSLRQAKKKALESQCASNLGQIGTAVSAYANANDNFLPAAMDQREQWLQNGNRPVVSNSVALFKLVNAKLVSASVFQCPAVGRVTLVVQPGMMDFPEAKYVSISYQHALAPEGPMRRDRFSPAEQESMVIAGDQSPVFADGRFHPDRVGAATSENHGADGQNVLYLAGHVRWVTQPDVGVNHDNIFLAGDLVDYQGDETAASRRDSFLLPAYSPKP